MCSVLGLSLEGWGMGRGGRRGRKGREGSGLLLL